MITFNYTVLVTQDKLYSQRFCNYAGSRYDASKTASRNDHAFVTCVADEEKAWRAKFERRKSNLTHGFFAEKSKPYQSVGTVYLEAGDLVLNSITEDLKSKVSVYTYLV